MRVLTISCLILALAASAMARDLQQSGDYYILLEDGTRMTYGDLRALSQNKCCFSVNFPFAVTYSSTNRIRFFISGTCDPAMEINASTYPASIKAIDLCASGCDPNKGCGLNGMNTKGVSTQGGKWPLNQGQECAYSDGRMMQDKTCKAVGKDNTFQYRLLCKQDCANKWTCQEPSFDKSKCAGQTTPVTTYAALGEKCGYVQDNKSYVCGGNHVSCQNGVCVSSMPSGGGGGGQTTPVNTFVALGEKCGYVQDNKSYVCGGNHVSCQNGVCVSSMPGK